MTPVQLKMARAALDLSVDQLATQAGLSHADIGRLESGETSDGTIDGRLRAVFEESGIVFIEQDTVQARPAATAATIPLGDMNSYNDK